MLKKKSENVWKTVVDKYYRHPIRLHVFPAGNILSVFMISQYFLLMY